MKKSVLMVSFLGILLIVSGCIGNSDTKYEDMNNHPQDQKRDKYVNNYPSGNSKTEGNYVSLDSLIQVRTDDESFNVTEVSVALRNNIELGSGFDDEITISRARLELRNSSLPSFKKRRDYPLEVKKDTKGTFISENLLEESISIYSKGKAARFSFDPDYDLKNVPFGCYNATVVVRELKGMPSPSNINNMRKHHLAGIKTQEICVSKGKAKGHGVELVSFPKSLALSIGDLPWGYKIVSENESTNKYKVTFSHSNDSIGNIVILMNSSKSARSVINNSLRNQNDSYDIIDRGPNYGVYIIHFSDEVDIAIYLRRENIISTLFISDDAFESSNRLSRDLVLSKIHNIIEESASELGISYEY